MVAAPKKNRRQRRLERSKGTRQIEPEDKLSICQRQRGIDESAPPGPEPARHLAPYIDGHPQSFAASEPWIDDQFTTIVDQTPDGPRTNYLYTPSVVPAGQVRCKRCGHLSPPHLISALGFCVDCRYHELDKHGNLPGSTSSVSLARIHSSRAKAEDITPGGMC